MTTPSREVRDAIEDLIAYNAWALDTHDLDRYLATHWEDATWADVHGDEVVTLTGIDEIREGTVPYFANRTGHQHRLQQQVYAPSDGDWTGWIVSSYYLSTVRQPDGTIELQTTGWIQDAVEQRGGEWRIRARTVRQWEGELRHPLA